MCAEVGEHFPRPDSAEKSAIKKTRFSRPHFSERGKYGVFHSSDPGSTGFVQQNACSEVAISSDDYASSDSCPNELVDSESEDEVMPEIMQALRYKTLNKKRHYRKPTSAHTDRSSNCGSLPVADDGSEVEEQNQHSPKRPTMPKRPPGVFWSTHKAVQECKDKHDDILQALGQAENDTSPGQDRPRSSGDTC